MLNRGAEIGDNPRETSQFGLASRGKMVGKEWRSTIYPDTPFGEKAAVRCKAGVRHAERTHRASEDFMAFRVNYNQQRSDRQRLKDQKKQEKLQRREQDAARRRAERGEDAPDSQGVEPSEGEPARD